MRDGAVFKYLQLIPESVIWIDTEPIKLHNWKGLLRIRFRFRSVTLPDNDTYVIVHNSYSGYYHWLLESVPKILEAQQAIPSFTLLLPASYTDTFYEATLCLLGLGNIERLHSDIMYRVPRLALPYNAATMRNHSAPMLHKMKAVFFNRLGIQQPVKTLKRLYISRRKANRRRVLNETEVEQLLLSFGFESVCFEDYNFAEQVHLCASAEILIGIHGAGLANMIFLPEKATVIEFRKFDNGWNHFFTSLASTLQYTCHLLYCAAEDEQQLVQDANLLVDLSSLRIMLSKVFARKQNDDAI